MTTYTYSVVGEEVDFEPIQANDIHAAAREVRRLLANPNVWASGTEPFGATVIIESANGTSSIKMPVECAVRQQA